MSIEHRLTTEDYRFCAVHDGRDHPYGSVHLGTVTADSIDDARAKVRRRFHGGFFYPNQIYVWRAKDELVIP